MTAQSESAAITTAPTVSWSELPELYRWTYSSGFDRAGRYVFIDDHLYNVRECVYSRHDARHFGITGWSYAFENKTGNGYILIRPTRGNVGKWPHEWTHIEFMTTPKDAILGAYQYDRHRTTNDARHLHDLDSRDDASPYLERNASGRDDRPPCRSARPVQRRQR